jgi:hypothetical protein
MITGGPLAPRGADLQQTLDVAAASRTTVAEGPNGRRASMIPLDRSVQPLE